MANEINELQLFNFNGLSVRIHVDDHGEPWFVAKDVAAILGYRMASDMARRLDEDEKGTHKTRTPSGTQEMTVINESGLYAAILRSSQPKAKEFRRWVTGEVLPTIRKTGGYIAAKPEDPPEVIMAKALKVADATINDYKLRLENAHKQIAELKPAAEYTEKVLSSTNLHTVKSIGVHLGVSAQKLNDFLVAQDWIYKQGRIYYPTSKICGKGFCDYQINAYVADPYTKEVRTREHLKWTEKGRQAVIQLWNEAHGVLDFGC